MDQDFSSVPTKHESKPGNVAAQIIRKLRWPNVRVQTKVCCQIL